METLLLAIGAFVLYLVAYHTYGRWLGRRIFRLNPDAVTPSVALEDGSDYVPTSKGVVFGHHFTSIAGTGPIVGPALAVMWGWLPALLWVIFGSIFIGAVHDFGSLVVSMRNRGQTVGDVAGRLLSPRVRLLFLLILFLALTIVLAIFGLVIAAVFKFYPAAIAPCLLQVPLALLIGVAIHRRGAKLLVPSLIALGLMYLSVLYGDAGWLKAFNHSLAAWPVIVWVAVLLVYSYIASVLPVWMLLQPRDYINSLQLLTALGLVVVGLIVAAFFGGAPIEAGGNTTSLKIVAPMIEHGLEAKHLPLIFPFLFVTVACGAISGFHCLVSSGTSSKQLTCEADARFVGYGAMLTEGFLAVIVILACTAGLGLGITLADGSVLHGAAAFEARYPDWAAAGGLKEKVAAFVDGSANFLRALGMGRSFATALMGVFVASFATTTLDTACRLQRYVVQELARTADRTGSRSLGFLRPLANKHVATTFAIVVAGGLATLPGPGRAWAWENAGTGGMILWPLFGATNQLLGGLAFLVILFWMWRRSLPVWFIVLPTIFMLVLPAWALLYQVFVQALGSEKSWIDQGNWLLVGVAAATVALEAWMLIEAALVWPKARGVLEEPLPPINPRDEASAPLPPTNC